MRLKSLKLAGFKSFANSTTFTFPRGITAIVGPNGCGKSNVIDAIRWVLGETSAKQLRGGAMSDVIFAGTQDKAAKSMASVELTFEHTQDEHTGIRHEFNLYHELSVRRQVNLEGRSDYFINGTRCRRRDVVDVFLGTGLGARSYAVIEQGMIGRIVESSPLQLREFIEEAAGVSRYQVRRAETQKKLSMTQDNLARLYDMQSELVRQQKSLAKQATSAQRYEELAIALADVKQQLAIQQLYQAKHTQQQHKLAHENSAASVATLQADYERIKAKQDKLSTCINQEQWLKDEAQSAHYQQQLSYQQAEQQLNNAQAQLQQIEQQLLSLDSQRQQAIAESETLQSQRDQQQEALAELRPQLSKLTAKRERYNRDEQPLKCALYEAQDQQSRLQESERKLEQQQALNAQSQQRQQLSQDKWSRRQQNWQLLWQQLQQPDTDKGSMLSIATLKEQLQQNARQQDSVAERLSELQPQARTLQQQLAAQQVELIKQEKSQASLAGEYDTLHQILHPKPVKNQQNLLSQSSDAKDKAASALHQPSKLAIATLREQIELTAEGQQYAQLLDSLLAMWLDSHVLVTAQADQSHLTAPNDSTASKANLGQTLEPYLAELLSYQQHNSRQQLSHSLWLPTKQTPKQTNKQQSIFDELATDLSAKILPLAQLIAQPALALWQQCYLYLADENVNSDKASAELATITKVLPPTALVLTTDGWIISRLGSVNLTKVTAAQHPNGSDQNNEHSNSQFLSQRLQQRQRLQQLETLLDESDSQILTQQQTIKRTQANYDALTVSLEETQAQAQRLTQDNYRQQQQLTTQQAANERQQAEEQRLQADQALLLAEQQELAQEQKVLDSEKQQIEHSLVALRPKLEAARANSQHLQNERNELNRNRQLDDNAWQSLQLTVQKGEMRLEHSTDSLARVNAVYEQAVQSELTLQKRLQTHKQQLPNIQAKLQAAQTTRDEQQALLAERETALTALKQDYSQQQIELDKSQTQLQTQQSKLASQATELALSEAHLQDSIQQTQDALDSYYQIINKNNPHNSPSTVSVSSLLTDFITHERRVRPDKITELQAESTKLTQQLSRIGPVNLAAIAELAQVNERLAPLNQQTEDIAASMQTLTEAIASIDETTKTLFMQTLDSVNSELAKLFAKVFGGGQASLTLNLEDMPADTAKSEQWRAGLTLMAQPKGKRNSRLAVLSGGEKTLTALSLIFAIFKQHPAPFCVLDEVDAPLDDANVGRFTSLIHELADDLQFIFISHNKLTMQIADELKGVTMPSAGISTLVSVSLDEAEHYVDL
ncbi:AAA family ATPase [Psychrobacter sp. TAE2020]|uniref:AAA family ATPase n=1 Tax=Psychrobacter sp. TAE2020 TaxID=2846762 RepID=UPI001C0FB137|nr:AAA family ATPase [Psychrobacter sp. TAE2020]MBU5616745.1 AAA family ATPase [Psychrobacter sp. TAE2020]